ncbi:unnamed protein product [Clonostachys rhizophaga]|uniref:Uncharacterized protein n=1 Tax=Clonostachys rhizophaga TaxID=160324 RepID=A0A9N9VQ92_9HYPO|nr:unnamed protein product [Clonostachys rhizophaga]
MMVERGKMRRSNIFRACRKELAVTNTDDQGSSSKDVGLSASTRVDDLSIPQCKDVFEVLHAAMKASGQPNPVPTDTQIEGFLKLVLGHDKALLQREITSTVVEQEFNPAVKRLIGRTTNQWVQEPVYGYLDFIGGSEMRYSLVVLRVPAESWDTDEGQPTTLCPNDVEFIYEEPTQWMSRLATEARLKLFKYVSDSNLLIAIQTARWCIDVRLLCKEPYVPSLEHYPSLAGVHAHPFVQISDFLYAHPFLAMACVQRPRTVFDELSPDSEMLVEMMQKIQYKPKTEGADNRWIPGNGWGHIAEEGEEESSYWGGEATCTEEEETYEDGAYEYEDDGFDDVDEGWDYEGGLW